MYLCYVDGHWDAVPTGRCVCGFRSPLDTSRGGECSSRGGIMGGYPTSLHRIPVPRGPQERDRQNDQDNRGTTYAPSTAGRHRYFSSCSTWPWHRLIVRSANSRHRGSWVTTTTVLPSSST